MSTAQENRIGAGYRSVGALLFVGVAVIGFGRLEDRAVLGVPGTQVNAMVANALPPSTGDGQELFPEATEETVALSTASRAPRNQINRTLAERDLPAGAARQILAPPAATEPVVPGALTALGAGPVLDQAFGPIDAPPPTFASLAPALAGTGTPIFATGPTPVGGGAGGGGAGGGTGGGAGGGGTGGGTGDGATGDGNTGGGTGDGTAGDGSTGGGTGDGATGDGSTGGGTSDGTTGGGSTGGGTGVGGDVAVPPPSPPPIPPLAPDPVSPVPEPGTWLMLIVGLFAVGGALRRQRQRAFLPAMLLR